VVWEWQWGYLGSNLFHLLAATTPKDQPQAPIRFAACFFGNGALPQHWGATVEQQQLSLKKSLSPLESLKGHLNVFQGLWNPTSNLGPGGHYPKMNVLSGLKVRQTTTDIELGITMDQVMANQIGHHTPLNSLALGSEQPSLSIDAGYTALYSAYISWMNATTPTPKEIFPQEVFDILFDDGSKRKNDKSVLDAIKQEVSGLKNQLSHYDKNKVEEYLQTVRELEQRIEKAEKIPLYDSQTWKPSIQTSPIQRPTKLKPADQREHIKLMLDLMVIALQMDKTRVVTNMITKDLSNFDCSFMGALRGGQHELSHHANDPKRMDSYQITNQYIVQLWADALQKMKETQEGERTLLDNSLMLLCSSLMDGNTHDSRELPILLAGGGGGKLRGGRLHDYSKENDRRLCRLHMSLIEMMGCEIYQFGDADQSLPL
jgi:hypothetical protein